MKHNIKLPDGTIQTLDCNLGSGITDKNGREIFEGDLIKNPKFNPEDDFDTPDYVVVYDPEEAAFMYRDTALYKAGCDEQGGDHLGCFCLELEIVGHVDD